MNRIMRRPMFRKGGSAGEGITSGLAPRQDYDEAGSVQQNDLSKMNLGELNVGQIRELADSMAYKAPPMMPDRSLDNFKIDFGLDLIGRPAAGNIFQTAALAAKEPFNRFRASRSDYQKSLQDRAVNKYNSQAEMFRNLLTAQANVFGSETGGKTYKDMLVAKELEKIIPEIYELKKKQDEGTITEDEIVKLDVVKTQKNNYTKKNPVTEGAIEIFVNSTQGQTLFNSISKNLLNEDNKNQGVKYKGNKNDVQLYIDTIEQIKIILGQFSGGGRAGYATGELVEEQVTETMTPGPQPLSPTSASNPISYEQLRARLPQEITDDIVQLMANSVEALEDFAMISTQQDVDNFNKKYNVNLVLPAEA